ncbi:MAG: PHP domain-containing protein [Candidatus Thorarchaeota archaeon]
MTGLADLHIHSSVSDGTEKPEKLVEMAIEIGLGGLALTDHDTTDGLSRFMSAPGPPTQIRVPGLEISTDFNSKEAHILAYYVPKEDTTLSAKLSWLREEREKRFPKMIKKMMEIGISVSAEELEILLKGVISPGRPHIGKILIDRGIVRDMNEAFDMYLAEGKPLYVGKERLSVNEAISTLRSVGAVPILAHPLDIGVPKVKEALKDLKEEGLMGVETVYDYSHLEISERPEAVREAAKELGLIATGGTDYHGDGWRIALGSIGVSVGVIDELRKAAEELGGDIYSWET